MKNIYWQIQPTSLTWLFAVLFLSTALVKASLADLIDSFAPGQGSDTAMGSYIYAFGVLPDGGVVVGGKFNQVGDQRVGGNLALFNKDSGSLDSTFVGYTSGTVHSIQVQPNGRILVAGSFTSANGVPQFALARLFPNGDLDSSLSVAVNGIAYTIIVNDNDEIIMGGIFNRVNNVACNNLVRLSSNGDVVSTYGSGVGAPGFSEVRAMALQKNGKLIVCGEFSSVQGKSRQNIARFDLNDDLDLGLSIGTNNVIEAVLVDADENIVFGGLFTRVGSVSRNYLARFKSDGSLDSTFDLNPSYRIRSLESQVDGRILIGGAFSTIAGVAQGSLVRIHLNGAIDNTFNANLTFGSVSVMKRQPDGKILVGGGFEIFDGKPRSGIARLYINSSIVLGSSNSSYASLQKLLAKYKLQLAKAKRDRNLSAVRKINGRIRSTIASMRRIAG